MNTVSKENETAITNQARQEVRRDGSGDEAIPLFHYWPRGITYHRICTTVAEHDVNDTRVASYAKSMAKYLYCAIGGWSMLEMRDDTKRNAPL